MKTIYIYRITRGEAYLNKGDDAPIKKIGKFKTDTEAKQACEKHYEKALKGLLNLGLEVPEKFYG
jgi:hypothetical protein